MRKILLFSFVAMVVCIWLFHAPNVESTIKVNLNPFSSRKLLALRHYSQSSCDEEIASYERIGLDSAIVRPFYDESEPCYKVVTNSSADKHMTQRIIATGTLVGFAVRVSPRLSVVEKNDSIYLSSEWGNLEFLANGDAYSCVFTSDKKSLFLLLSRLGHVKVMQYAILDKKFVDSFDIQNLLPTKESAKYLVHYGSLAGCGESVLYKSMYSSFGILFSKGHLGTGKIFQTIDSLALPSIVEKDLGGGASQEEPYPHLYPSWRTACFGDCFYNLTELGKDRNYSYIDVYTVTDSVKYSHTYMIYNFASNLAFDFSIPDARKFDVLFADQKTIRSYEMD
jgi:hypothetical protein